MNTFFLVAISLAATSLRAAEVDDGWRNLNQVTHDRDYVVILRDGHCAHGSLISASGQAVVFSGDPGKDLVIKRADVLRISDNNPAPMHDAIFSGRSSWMDVKAAAPKATEYLHIVTKRGEEQKWKQPAISDDSVTFQGRTIAKADIRYVSYVRTKPLTSTEEYFLQERVQLFAPRLWFNGLMLGKISVLLYNSELAEDNSPTGCH